MNSLAIPEQSFFVDLRSDTVTRPTAGMRKAMADAEVGDDILDGDPTTNRLEAYVAELLGKERALFFPSGSMASMAAVLTHTAPGTEMLLDADSHIIHWDMAASAAFAGVQIRPVRAANSIVMRATDLAAAIRPVSGYSLEASLVHLENTHNHAGGVVTSLPELKALQEIATRAGLPVHLDGARLWNAAAATGTSLASFAACADTVMVSFSKGLGAPVGAALAGTEALMEKADLMRKRLGGGMRQSGIIAAGALYGLQHHLARLPDDHAAARALAGSLQGIEGIHVIPPDSNIVMVDLSRAVATDVVAEAAERGVRISAWTPSRIRAVTHLDAPFASVETAGRRLAEAIAVTMS